MHCLEEYHQLIIEIFTVWTVFIQIAHIINLKKHERVYNNHDYCRVDIPKEYEKIKCGPGDKSLKAPFIIYADLERLLKKVQYC